MHITTTYNDNGEYSNTQRIPIWLMSASIAEMIASIALCPLEVTRLKMVTQSLPSPSSLSLSSSSSSLLSHHHTQGLLQTMKTIYTQEGLIKGFFTGLPLILLRQIPYTCVKLVTYEILKEKARKHYLWMKTNKQFNDDNKNNYNDNKNKNSNSKISSSAEILDWKILVSCGMIAGAMSAIISQPADSLLSLVCGGESKYGLVSCPLISIQSPGDIITTIKEIGLSGKYIDYYYYYYYYYYEYYYYYC